MSKGIIYLLRRKLQIAASYFLSKETLSKIYFKIVLGEKLNLDNPKTFNEKIQWLKLYEWPNNELAIKCADKYAVREYVKSCGYEDLLNDLYGVWDNADDINWAELPDRFVLKCNHGCGYNIICPDKSKLDEKSTKKQLNKWLKEDFGRFNIEPHYSKIKPKIICEKFLGSDIVNYNVFCCNNNPEFISVIQGLGGGSDEALTYYYSDGNIAPFRSKAYPICDRKLPECVDLMLRMAKELSQPFPFVRVDFYLVKDRIILSELTFTPGGALIPFYPISYDVDLGEKLKIRGE